MLKLAAKSRDYRVGLSLFRRDRATSVRPKPPVSAVTLAYADAAIQVMDAASHPHLAMAREPDSLRTRAETAVADYVALHTAELSKVTEEYREASKEWSRMEEAGEVPEDYEEREELLRSTEAKCEELHQRMMRLKQEASAAMAEAAEIGGGKWDGRPPPGSRAARLKTSWELLHGSFWIHEWIGAMTAAGSLSSSSYDDRLAALDGGDASLLYVCCFFKPRLSSYFHFYVQYIRRSLVSLVDLMINEIERRSLLDGVLSKAAHTLGSAYLVPLVSGECVTLERWCAERLVNPDEHLVLKSPWTKEVQKAFEKMQSQVIKMYELAFNRYNGVCEKCGRSPGVGGARNDDGLRMISCSRCRSACWCSEKCKYDDANRHAELCLPRDALPAAGGGRVAGGIGAAPRGNQPLHRALSGMDADGKEGEREGVKKRGLGEMIDGDDSSLLYHLFCQVCFGVFLSFFFFLQFALSGKKKKTAATTGESLAQGAAAAAAAAGNNVAAPPPDENGEVFKPLSLFGSHVSQLVGSMALIAPSAKFPDV